MRAALAAAERAAEAGEVPVGAVVVHAGRVIATGWNRPVGDCDPSAHAEMVALRAAAQVLGNYRLPEAELFVTLEPCSMCAGAVLQARLKKVTFGAHDAKAGAAGSVVDLFAEARINHQTQVEGGLLGEECAILLRDFFAARRTQAKERAPMQDVLRTPDARFADLPGYPFAPHYIGDLKGYQGLRIHYLDEGPREARLVFLCLHGQPSWSYLYRRMIPVLADAGHRVVAPDLIGFGKSDKPVDEARYTFMFHRGMLANLVLRLDLQNVVLVCQDWGGLLGLTLPMDMPERFCGLLVMNTDFATGDAPLSPGFLAWRDFNNKNPDMAVGRLFARACPHLSAAEAAAYDAPFPDATYKAGVRRFPNLVPDHPDVEGAALSRRARAWFTDQWQGRTLMAVGMRDPVLGPPVMSKVAKSIRGCPPPMEVPDGGHFVQEWGEDIARRALQVFGN
ncbi:MAG: tRNA adenosine(34) deaminase TadA [Burkholderiales bacterium]|nr:tRNA adenosine(34) deaminase TadA [Burkholderiales bacterium]